MMTPSHDYTYNTLPLNKVLPPSSITTRNPIVIPKPINTTTRQQS